MVLGEAEPTGMGFTTTVAVTAFPLQPFAVEFTVNVTVTGAFVVLVKDPLISAVPFAAIPVTVAVLFRDQV